MNWKTLTLTTIAISTMAIGGCANNLTGDTYTTSQARTVQSVRFGTVQAIRMVQIQSEGSMVGTLAGAVIGGLAGSTIGGGRGSDVAAVAGAVAGGAAGSAIEKNASKTQGIEITVRLDNGESIAITQEASPNEIFRVGDHVRVLSGSGTTRVQPQ